MLLSRNIPSDEVIASAVHSSSSAKATVTPTALTFTSEDYLQPFGITVEPVDNLIDDGDLPVHVIVSATFRDVTVDYLSPSFWCLNDDHAGLNATRTALRVNETGTLCSVVCVWVCIHLLPICCA